MENGFCFNPFGSPPPAAPPPLRDEVVEGVEGTRKAVMLRYNDDGEAEVIGVAEGAAAEAMLREARERGVEIRQDADTVKPAASLLRQVPSIQRLDVQSLNLANSAETPPM